MEYVRTILPIFTTVVSFMTIIMKKTSLFMLHWIYIYECVRPYPIYIRAQLWPHHKTHEPARNATAVPIVNARQLVTFIPVDFQANSVAAAAACACRPGLDRLQTGRP
jgi:hypothetical protein